MATVYNDKNWITTTSMDQLLGVPAVSQGPRHCPVNHGEMLQMFRKQGLDEGIKVTAEHGLLSPDGQRFMYTADIMYDVLNSDYNFTIGFVNFNDRSRSFTGLAGQRVMICSNLCVTGVLEASKTRHSTNVGDRILEKIKQIYLQFDEVCKTQIHNIEGMKGTVLNDDRLGLFLLEATRKGIMGAANLRRVVEEVDKPSLNNLDDSSLWRLHNAATYVLRENVRNPLQQVESSKLINDAVLELI